MRRELFALLNERPDEVTLAELGRALKRARRRDAVPVSRSFVSSATRHLETMAATQRIRVVFRTAV
jgi:hypothetical protein